MHREGHVGIGLLLYSPIAYFLVRYGSLKLFALGMVGMAFWSFAPDVDMSLPIRHRGPTHSFVATVVAGVLTAGIGLYLLKSGLIAGLSLPVTGLLRYGAVTGFGFLIGFTGVVGHLLGDAMTPMKIRPWWPWSSREHGIYIVYAANEDANAFLSKIGAIAVVVAIVLGEGVSIPNILSIPF